MKYERDPLVIIVSLLGFVAILIAQRLFMITHTDSSGLMDMDIGMDGSEKRVTVDDSDMSGDMDMHK